MTIMWKEMSVVVLLTMLSGGLQAGPLWDTGVGSLAGASTSHCDSGPGTCAIVGNQAFTIFDNFTVGPTGWVVSSIDFTDFFASTNRTSYTNGGGTNWSIWNGDPTQAGSKVVASGNAMASLMDITGNSSSCLSSNCLVKFTINIPSVTLASGQYYLGTTNLLTGGTTNRALGTAQAGNQYGVLSGWNQAEGTAGIPTGNSPYGANAPNSPFTGTDTSFDIQGALAPEPGTWGLMTLAVAGIGILRRRLSR